MTTSAGQTSSAFELSEGALKVLQEIMQISDKSPGAVLAEGLTLAKLYEQTRKGKGRMLLEVDGKLQEITIPS